MKNNKVLMIIFILIGVLLLVLCFLLFSDRTVSKLTIDVNPSIEIRLNGDEKVKKVIPINNDAKNIVDSSSKSLKKTVEKIVDNIINSGYSDKRLYMLVSIEGKISEETVKKVFDEVYKDKELTGEYIVQKVSKNETIKYNLSNGRSNIIKEILKYSSALSFEELLSKQTSELEEIKNTHMYCDEGYKLDNDKCIKPSGKEKAISGKVCPSGYYEYNNKCYKEGQIIESNKLICPDGLTLENDKCVGTFTVLATPVCEKGEYNSEKESCVENKLIIKATGTCEENYLLFTDNKCYLKHEPVDNTCETNYQLIEGGCYNIAGESVEATWTCPEDSTINDTDKNCYQEIVTKPIKYTCEKGFTLEGTKCTSKDNIEPTYEKSCSEKYSLVDNNKCINFNSITDFINGYICTNKNSKLENGECIIYEVVDANKL